MGTFAEISSWLQLILMLGLLVLAYLLAKQFQGVSAWRTTWMAFAIGFAGMFESRIFVILFAYEIESPWMRFCGRFISPLQASIGLFLGMLLLYRLLHHLGPAHAEIPVPRPAGFTLDTQSRVLAWDTGAEAMFGWTATEAIGQLLQDLLSPPRLQWRQITIVDRHLEADATGLQTHRYTLMVRKRQTGPEFPVEVLLSGAPGHDGALQFTGLAWRLTPSL